MMRPVRQPRVHLMTLRAPLRMLGAAAVVPVVLACAGGAAKAGLGPNEDPVTVIALTPAATPVVVGEVVLVSAQGRTPSGQVAPVSVDWTASGGSVVPLSDSEAQFSATTAGTYQVYARGTVAPYPLDSATIAVVPSVSPIARITVGPDSVSMSLGEIQPFTATATRVDGSSFIPSVSWSATGGTITSDGLYSAGSAAGTFRVIATQQGGTLADTSAVTLVPPPPPGANPHEPAGMTVAFDEAWNTTPNGRTGSQNWITDNNPNGGGNFTIVTDATAPISPGNVFQVLYPAGKSGGSAPAHAYYAETGHLPTNTGMFYTRVQIKLSSNWTDNGNAGTKFFFPRSGKSGENCYINLTSSGNFRPAWSENGQTWNASDSYYITGTLTKGVWHDMEILLYQGSSATAKDGYAKIWVDGVMRLNQTGLQMLPSGAPLGFSYLFLDPTYGGGSHPVPADQNFQIDHWYASVK
jgi:hypothetical protein